MTYRGIKGVSSFSTNVVFENGKQLFYFEGNRKSACVAWGWIMAGGRRGGRSWVLPPSPSLSQGALLRFRPLYVAVPGLLLLSRSLYVKYLCLTDHHGSRRLHQVHQVSPLLLELHLLGEQPCFVPHCLCPRSLAGFGSFRLLAVMNERRWMNQQHPRYI